jgi:hypothetical protein
VKGAQQSPISQIEHEKCSEREEAQVLIESVCFSSVDTIRTQGLLYIGKMQYSNGTATLNLGVVGMSWVFHNNLALIFFKAASSVGVERTATTRCLAPREVLGFILELLSSHLSTWPQMLQNQGSLQNGKLAQAEGSLGRVSEVAHFQIIIEEYDTKSS